MTFQGIPQAAETLEHEFLVALRLPRHGRRPGRAEYQSPWYTGQESVRTPEPGAHQQWREARSDWLQTRRPEDFERMLASVTLDNPPLARDIRYSRQLRAKVPRPATRNRVRDAAALTAAAATAMTVAVMAMLALLLTLIGAAVDACRPGPASEAAQR